MTTSVNREVLRQQIKVFDVTASAKKIYTKTKKLNNSQGAAIDAINNCLKEYDAYFQAINDLYGATGTYLHGVASNFDACEIDNLKK